MRKILGFIIAVLVLVGCSTLDCPLNNSVYTYYKVMSDSTVDTLSVISFRHTDNEGVLLNKLANPDSLQLPISYTGDKDILYFVSKMKSGTETIDTVVITKSNFDHFESVDCSPSVFHKLLDVTTTHHAIDSIVINHRDVDYDYSKKHFSIYFRHLH
jgi:hypothetical protein